MAEMFYQRDVYGKALVELGRENANVVALDADLSGSTRTAFFAKEFPDRFFNLGVAEQNLIGVAGGLAKAGKIPFASTFAIFASGRAWDQIRNTIACNNLNVKIVATHAGISVGPDGASHQALEDIALMRVLPHITIIAPCDGPETKQAVLAAAKHVGPVYIRLGRPKVPSIEGKGHFKLGKGYVLRKGRDITIIACGIMVKEAEVAARILGEQGIDTRIVNIHTIKPIDKELIINCAKETRGIVVCEEHMVIGGLGSEVSRVLDETPTLLARIGVRDRFGQSGDPDELMKEYNLTAEDIAEAARRLLKGKL